MLPWPCSSPKIAMVWLYRKAKVLLSVYYAYMLEYRAELFLWALSGSLPIILLGVWMQAAQGGGFPLSPVEFARYFLAIFIIRQLTLVWVIWEFEKEVVEGKLSFALLQPLDPLWRHVAQHLSERFARLPFSLGLIALFFLLYPQSFWVPSADRLALCLGTCLLAFVMRFAIQYTFALASFWMERASALDQLWFAPYLFLSGYIAPLEVFPPLMREIALWTPFPYMLHFPAALLLGLPVDLPRGIAVMVGWTVVFSLLNRWLWRKGLRQYSGMGA